MPWRPDADLRALTGLVAPAACAGCEAPGRRWCRRCAVELLAGGPRPWRPTPCPAGFPPTWSGPAYADAVRAGLVAWKEQDRVDLTAVLAPVLRDGVRAALACSADHRAAVAAGRPVAVVPAPSARGSRRRRGRSPVRELAVAAVGRAVVLPALVLARPVQDQAGLSAQGRAANLDRAVALAPRAARALAGIPCVVVDDVVTTGATLTECARALREGGAGAVVAATLAATARRGQPPSPDPLPRPGAAD
ncbi:phosphoribosyltransferase family protein [Serinicoccus kebangsaanensis]|uniref:phosphoribosyltransferase family protein n=1 Tax=Serinicoccus kebangsaanensis TaxID=2602069 RepID=UPI00124C7CE4|nr:phosphoribosyltransferase family protein [Serinicoccus kebangsaanensis]